MNPRVRFAMTMSFLVVVYWLWNIANKYLFGDSGLNFDLFFTGVLTLGFAAACGFGFVWIGVKFITFQQYRKTGFEEDTVDEYGTTFNWPIMLSKFVPEVVAPPVNAPISPLEQELIGFLNGYRHWPQDVENPDGPGMAETAMRRWHAVKDMHNTTPLHRAAALSIDLGKVIAYGEKREIAPWTKPWKQDKVKFFRKTAEHGGFSAFVLSTFNAFRHMPEDERQTLLLAVRYGRDPMRIPTNAGKVVNHIVETLNRAESTLNLTDSDTSPQPEDNAALQSNLQLYLQGILRQIPLTNTGTEDPAGVYVGGKNPLLMVELPALVARLAVYLPAQSRTRLGLWENKSTPHNTWPLVLDTLKEMDVLAETYEGESGDNGLFSLKFGGKVRPYCLILNVTGDKLPMVAKAMSTLPATTDLPEPAVDDAALLSDIKAKALSVDNLLS